MYRNALEINQQLNDWGQQAENLANLANLEFARGHIDASEEMHHRALKLYQEAGDEKGVGSEYRSLGSIWFKRGDVDQAQAFFQLGIELHEEIGWSLGIALACSGMAGVLERRQQYDQAEASRLRRSSCLGNPGTGRTLPQSSAGLDRCDCTEKTRTAPASHSRGQPKSRRR